MFRTLVSGCIVAAAMLGACAVHAQSPLLDPSFGQQGLARINSTIGSPRNDVAVGICPGPGDTQVAISTRLDPAMLMLARVRRDGTLDPAFGIGGRVERAIEMPNLVLPRNLCFPDGRIEIAYGGFGGTIEVLRFLPDGDADGSFGMGGRFSVTVSSLPNANSGGFSLRGMDRGPGGEILLGGTLVADENSYGRAALLRVRSNGSLRDARIFDENVFSRGAYIAASAYAPSGDLWVAGGFVGVQMSSWFRMELNGATLVGSAPVRGTGAYGENLRINGGRMIRPGVMVLSGIRMLPSVPSLPVLFVLRENGSSELVLPPPAGGALMVDSTALGILTLPGDRILYGGTTNGPGLYFARAQIGASSANDTVDSSFGANGAATLSIPGTPAGCKPLQQMARLSVWGGTPVFVASARADCEPGTEADLVVGLFGIEDVIFANAFESDVPTL
ncbi:MAG: hypothetical protein ABIO49_10765 [Dokdonella sp.]